MAYNVAVDVRGVGDPLSREPEAVTKDILWGLVSRGAAKTEYGVVLDDEGEVATADAESRCSELLSGHDGELLQFDRGPVPLLKEHRAEISAKRREFSEWLSRELGGT